MLLAGVGLAFSVGIAGFWPLVSGDGAAEEQEEEFVSLCILISNG